MLQFASEPLWFLPLLKWPGVFFLLKAPWRMLSHQTDCLEATKRSHWNACVAEQRWAWKEGLRQRWERGRNKPRERRESKHATERPGLTPGRLMESFSQFQCAQVLICSIMAVCVSQPKIVVEASTPSFAYGSLFFLQVQRQTEATFPFHARTTFHLYAVVLFVIH